MTHDLRAVHLMFLFRPCQQVHVVAGEVAGVVLEIGIGVEAGPVLAPLLDFLQQSSAFGLILFVVPVHLVGDDDRRDADLQVRGKFVQVVIGQHHAAVAGTRRAAVGVAGRAVQPDAAAGAAVLAIPFVRVAERIGTTAIHVGKLVFRQFGIDEIHANRSALIAFGNFFGAKFADGDVEVSDVARFAVHVLIHVQRGAAGIHDQSVFLLLVQFPQIARCELERRLGLDTLQAHQRFIAQILDFVARRIGSTAKTVDLTGACHQQIAFDQLRQLEFRVGAQQAVNFVERNIQTVVFECLQTFRQLYFGSREFGSACAEPISRLHSSDEIASLHILI